MWRNIPYIYFLKRKRFSVFASWYWLTKDFTLSIRNSYFIYSFLGRYSLPCTNSGKNLNSSVSPSPSLCQIFFLFLLPQQTCFFLPTLVIFLHLLLSHCICLSHSSVSIHQHLSLSFLSICTSSMVLEWSYLYHQVSHYLSFFLVIFLPPSVHLRFCLTGNSLLGFKQRWMVSYSISWGMLLISITYEDLLPHQEVFPVLHTCFKIKITDNMKVKLNFQ